MCTLARAVFSPGDVQASGRGICRLQVTRRNLEQLRAIKTRMVRLFTKVETIRELLERLLNDDDDMRDMNLSAKCALPWAVTCSPQDDGLYAQS